MVVVIRDAGGAELARKVIGVGGLAPGEERKVELSVEISTRRTHDTPESRNCTITRCASRRGPTPPALACASTTTCWASSPTMRSRTARATVIGSTRATTPRFTCSPALPEDALAAGELDVTSPHLAYAVESIDEAQAELDRLTVTYRVVHGRLGPDSRRLFFADPAGNLIELHQLGTCRCTGRAREGIGQARVSGTVLFADMRGFTAVAERLAPCDVVPLLNEYFSMLSAVTRDHGGTVFHMAGDGLMAGFGLPLPADDASEGLLPPPAA